MKYSESLLQDILQKTDLVELVGSFVSLKPNGKRWWGCCPFHQEKSASFTVNPQLNFFYCFGCKEKGNAFQFLMKIEHLSFPEAVEKLAQKTGIILPNQEETPQDKQKQAQLDLFRKLAGTFHHLLLTHPEAEVARQTLQKRGISQEMIETFQLGYALKDRFWLKGFLKAKNFSEDFLQKSGLFSTKYPDLFLFSGRLLFPIRLHNKDIVGFGGRLLSGDDGPKYLNSPETEVFQKRKSLYALDLALPVIREKGEALLCEGYMDAIALHQSGITWAVAPLGTSFTEDQAHFLKRYCKTVYCLFDSDEAGQKATAKAIEICEPLEMDTKVIFIRDSKDPAEILEKKGPESVKELVENPQKGFDFLLTFYYNLSNRNSTLDLAGFLRLVFVFIRRLTSEVKKETALQKTAEFLGVSKESLQKDFSNENAHQTSRQLERLIPAEKQEVLGRSLEWGLLMTVLLNPSLYMTLRKSLCQEDFEEPRSRKLFDVLETLALSEKFETEGFPFESVCQLIGQESWSDLLIRDAMQGEFEINPERVVADGVRRIKITRLEAQSRKLSGRLLEPGIAQDEMTRLLQEKNFLIQEISRLKRNV